MFQTWLWAIQKSAVTGSRASSRQTIRRPFGGQRRGRGLRGGSGPGLGDQVALAGEIDDEADQHADAREGEGHVPAVGLPERAGHQGGDEGAEADHRGVELEGHDAAAVVWSVELADLRLEIAAQGAGAQDQQQHGQQERLVEGHAEVPGGHQKRAQRHGSRAPQNPVAQPPADGRGHIDEAHVEAEDLGREPLGRQVAEQALDGAPERRKADNPFYMARQQQLLGHVEGEQRLHPMEGDAVPKLRAGQHHQATGMSEDLPAARRRLVARQCGHLAPVEAQSLGRLPSRWQRGTARGVRLPADRAAARRWHRARASGRR